MRLRAAAVALLVAACATAPAKPKVTVEIAQTQSGSYAVFVFNRSDELIIVSSIRIGEISRKLAEPVQANSHGRFDFGAEAAFPKIVTIDVDYFTDRGRFSDSCTCTVNYLRE